MKLTQPTSLSTALAADLDEPDKTSTTPVKRLLETPASRRTSDFFINQTHRWTHHFLPLGPLSLLIPLPVFEVKTIPMVILKTIVDILIILLPLLSLVAIDNDICNISIVCCMC